MQLLDLRDEHDFNLFHVGGARRVDPATSLEQPAELKALLDAPASTVTFLVGNGEAAALAAWKALKARGVPNLYVIEGGVNAGSSSTAPPACVAERVASVVDADDARLPLRLRHRAEPALGLARAPALARVSRALQGRRPPPAVAPGPRRHGITWPDLPVHQEGEAAVAHGGEGRLRLTAGGMGGQEPIGEPPHLPRRERRPPRSRRPSMASGRGSL